jgi:MFS family permease
MGDSDRADLKKFQEQLRSHGPKTFQNLLSAVLMWLFGNLVFIPLADTLGWQTRILCTLLFFVTFTILILAALPDLRKLIDSFSVLPAKKVSRKSGLDYKSSTILSRNILQILLALIFYLLYSPFLASFHPSINGIALILVLVWIFFLASSILHVSLPKILRWISS